MNFDEVAESDLETLKCVLCSNWLSCFPIHLTDRKENICGRCDVPAERNTFMNEAFQTLAKHIFFPCRYTVQGCDQKLRPKEVISHEKKCLFRIVKCPVKGFSLCIWEGAKPNVIEHCHESHSHLFLNGGQFNLLLSSDDITVQHNLLEHNSVLFVIVQKFNPFDQFLDFSIFHIESDEDLDQFSCEVELRTDKRHLVASCSTTSYQNQEPTEIYLNSLKDSKHATTISATGIVRLQNSGQHNFFLTNINNTTDLLTQLKCNNCETYILPPILQYIDASNNQKIVCSKCPALGGSPSKNLTLDNLANLIDYPCENTKRGCDFVAKPSSMLKHMKLCLYQNLSCPVMGFYHSLCNWNGLYENLKIHLQANHLDLYIDRSTVISVKVANCLGKQPSTEPGSTLPTSSHSNFHAVSKFVQSNSSTATKSSDCGLGNVDATFSQSIFGSSQQSIFGSSQPEPPVLNFNTSAKPLRKTLTIKSRGFNFASPAIAASSATSNLTSSLFMGSTVGTPFGNVVTHTSHATNTANSTDNNPLTSETSNLKNLIPVSTPAVDQFLKKQCHLTKFSNRLFRIIYGETAEKLIWYVHIIGPFTEDFMFCLDIVDKKNTKKIFKMALPSVDFAKEEDIINSSCFVWKKDISTYLIDNEISFKISLFK